MRQHTTYLGIVALALALIGIALGVYQTRENATPPVVMDTGVTPPIVPPSTTPEVPVTSTSTPEVVVTTPLSDTRISSPLSVEGEAMGTWFFEGSFVVDLVGDDGKTIATGIATSTEDWMTERMIPFATTLTWSTTTARTGTLIIHKENPSGEASRERSFKVPVSF